VCTFSNIGSLPLSHALGMITSSLVRSITLRGGGGVFCVGCCSRVCYVCCWVSFSIPFSFSTWVVSCWSLFNSLFCFSSSSFLLVSSTSNLFFYFLLSSSNCLCSSSFFSHFFLCSYFFFLIFFVPQLVLYVLLFSLASNISFS